MVLLEKFELSETMKKMNVNIHQTLSELSNKSDKLIDELKTGPEKEMEWFEKIKELVDNVVNGVDDEEDDEETLKFTSKHIPTCLSYIQGGTGKIISSISSALPEQERHHLHKKSTRCRKSTLKVKSQSLRNSRNATFTAETSGSAGQEDVPNSSINRTFVKEMDCTTPMMVVAPLTPVNKTQKMTLEKELFQKKLKTTGVNMSEPPHLVVRTSRFSTGKKLSGSSDTAKLSVYGSRISTKTSALEKKTRQKAIVCCKEGVVAENIKKMKEAKLKMIEEKKRLRDEKMERTKENRLKIETAKTECVKQKIKDTDSRSLRARERTETKRTRSQDTTGSSAKTSVKVAAQKPGPKSSKKPRIESSDGEETDVRQTDTKAARFESSKVSETPVKVNRFAPQSQTPKAAKTPRTRRATPTRRTPMTMETPAKGKKRPPQSKSPADTPAKKKRPTSPHSVVETPVSGKAQDIKSSTKRRATPPIKSQPLTVTPLVVRHHASGEVTVIKKGISKNHSSTAKKLKSENLVTEVDSSSSSGKGKSKPESHSSTAKELKSENSVTKVDSSSYSGKGKSKPESYEMTPDRSSFTSYDMSEIVSDDDEEETSTQKRIPSWAVGLSLRNALLHQFYNPPDTDEIFGSYLEPPNLEVIFEVQKKGYQKRTSSANWNSPGMFQ